MKKIIITLILALIIVVSFSSCDNPKEDPKKFIVGEWILVGDNLGHKMMDGESEHFIFNANGTVKLVNVKLGGDTITENGKYYIVNENTIAMASKGEQQKDYHFEIIGENQLHLENDSYGNTLFYERANNGK